MLHFEVSVTALAAFGQGIDINARLSSQSSAMEGIRGHQRVQAERPDDYQKERSIRYQLKHDEFDLVIRGRADGYTPGGAKGPDDHPQVEEIKTTRLPLADIPDLLKTQHHRQLVLYGYLLCIENDLDCIGLQLTYFNLDDQSQKSRCKVIQRDALTKQFNDILAPYLDQLQTRMNWIKQRNQSITESGFPFSQFRKGQRELAKSVYRTIMQNQQLVIQAPTGLGKTLATLFPAVKSLGTASLEKIFFFTAKTAAQGNAENAVSAIQNSGAILRSVTISGKSRTCFNPELPCDPEYCQYAKGYYQRLGPALMELRQSKQHLGKSLIEKTAKAHRVCPFELALDTAREADVVVADYNYLFNPTVRLKRFFEDQKGDYAILVDEAHNLVERGREMFSASLEKDNLRSVLKIVSTNYPALKKRLQSVNRQLLTLKKHYPQLTEKPAGVPLDRLKPLIKTIDSFCLAMDDQLDDFSLPQNDILDLYFEFQRFLKIYEQVDECYVSILTWTPTKTLKLFCIDPSSRLKDGFRHSKSAVCFSATMSPKRYFAQLLGLSQEASWQQVPSPFSKDHFQVIIASFIPVTYKARQQALEPLVSLIHQVTSTRRGNYLVYFPSLKFLGQVAAAYSRRFPADNIMVQSHLMDDRDIQDFLDQFDQAGQMTGFAVIGGRFSEGIDLVGDRLIGAIIIGTGLPQINSERDFIRDYYPDETMGFEMAYRLPGMNRILQSAGRVIRDEADKGVICLVDPRFTESRYRQLMPDAWPVEVVRNSGSLQQAMVTFWSQADRVGSLSDPAQLKKESE